MPLVPTFTEEDINYLQPGDQVDFLPAAKGKNLAYTRACFLTWDNYSHGHFTSRDDQDPNTIYDFRVRRNRLSPTNMGFIQIQDRTAIAYEEITLDSNPLLFERRNEELNNQ